MSKCVIRKTLEGIAEAIKEAKPGSVELKVLEQYKEDLQKLAADRGIDLQKSDGDKAILDTLKLVDTSKQTPDTESGGVWVMRNGKPIDFGNPFVTQKEYVKTDVDFYVGENNAATLAYYKWLMTNELPVGYDGDRAKLDARRKTILANLGRIRDAKALIYKGTAVGKQINHVTALQYVADNPPKEDTGTTKNTITLDNLPNRRSTKGDMNHTGGAYGADSIWANLLRPYGVTNVHYRPINDKPPKGVATLKNAGDKIVGITDEENSAGNALNTKIGNSATELNNRNLVQVYNADKVFAVAPIVNGKVTGGTGSAVRLAEHLNREVYVLNTEDVQWYKSKDGKYVKIDYVPKMEGNFAAVGTRKIEQYSTPVKDKNGNVLEWRKSELVSNYKEVINAMKTTVDASYGKQLVTDAITTKAETKVKDGTMTTKEQQEASKLLTEAGLDATTIVASIKNDIEGCS